MVTAGAMQAAPRVFPPRLVPLGQLLVVQAFALHIRVRHQVNVAVHVAFETHQDHTCAEHVELYDRNNRSDAKWMLYSNLSQ